MTPLPWTHTIVVAQLAPQATLILQPDAATRAALARHVGALDVPELIATLTLDGDGKGGVAVAGRLHGRVVQACVVTLDPMESIVDEKVAVRFVPQERQPKSSPAAEIEVMPDADDPPEFIVDGRFDLGAVLTEFFSLGVDPYPRKPDATWQPAPEDDDTGSPFAALAKLKESGLS